MYSKHFFSNECDKMYSLTVTHFFSSQTILSKYGHGPIVLPIHERRFQDVEGIMIWRHNFLGPSQVQGHRAMMGTLWFTINICTAQFEKSIGDTYYRNLAMWHNYMMLAIAVLKSDICNTPWQPSLWCGNHSNKYDCMMCIQ